VRASDLCDGVSGLVSRGNLNQLAVYFAGHGFINSYSEHWMLSQAPDNPNEAVGLVESVALARQSAIPNVVFIADACRSRSDSLCTERVPGSLIFPNRGGPPASPSDVDQFLAILVGDASWEVPVIESAGAYEGIDTGAFLDAYRFPMPRWCGRSKASGSCPTASSSPISPVRCPSAPSRCRSGLTSAKHTESSIDRAARDSGFDVARQAIAIARKRCGPRWARRHAAHRRRAGQRTMAVRTS